MKQFEYESNTGPQNEKERLQQLLCAVILGEASAAEQGEVERALAKDHALRTERTRLEATIGLVRGTLGSGEMHAPHMAGRIEALARAKLQAAPMPSAPSQTSRPAQRQWWTTVAFRMAAGLATILGAYGLVRRWGQPAYIDVASGRQAQAPSEARAKDERVQLRAPAVLSEADRSGVSAEGASNLARADFDEAAEKANVDKLDKNASARKVEVLAAAEPIVTPSSSTAALEQQLGKKLAGELQPEAEQPAQDGARGFGGNPMEIVDQVATQSKEKQAPGAELTLGLSVQPAPAEEKLRFRSLGYTQAYDQGLFAGAPVATTPAAPSTPPATGTYRGPTDSVAPARQSDPAQPVAATGNPSSGFYFHERKARGESPADQGDDVLDVLAKFEDGSDTSKKGSDEFFLGQGRDDPDQGRFALTPEECEAQTQILLRACQPRPGERPRDMFFRWWGDNPFVWTATDSLSTFAVDVDTASYTLARKYLQDGLLPEKAQIRTEEFVNAFDADVAAPSEGTFAVASELAPDVFAPSGDRWLLRVTLRGKDVPRQQRQPLRLTFVIDVSGSMREGGRLELVKHALRLLAHQLDERDEISIVTFSTEAKLVLPMTSAARREAIESAIHPLTPLQGTNAQAGLRLGFEHMHAHLAKGASHRVVLLSDGVANVGNTDGNQLSNETERYRKQGIHLSTIGVGMNNHNDALLELLADKGDGTCAYIDDEREAREALVERFTGAFEVIARDAKIQVEFDPAQVEQYRLLGYENRAVADRDFRNDAVDAGEVHSGHQVVALYELVRSKAAESEKPLATVRVRWKEPYVGGVADSESDYAREQAWVVDAGAARQTFQQAGAGYRTSALVAQFAEFLRRSVHARGDSFDQFLGEVARLEQEVRTPQVAEFAQLVRQSDRIVRAEIGRYAALQRCYDDLRHHTYLYAQVDELKLQINDTRRQELERERQRLELELRDLMRKRCQGG